jgi:LysM repeat protein
MMALIGWLMTSAPAHAQDKTTAEQYIATYKDLAISEMKRTGIPASITLAQGLIESGSGNSYLAKNANNHFGIKCKTGWTGRSVSVTDDAPDECFRAYNSAEESYRDHSDFLVNGQRYASLFELDPTDYKGWANGLRNAGYATNPKYPQMLIDVIERYGLYQYDAGNKRSFHQKDEIAGKEEKSEHLKIDESGFTYNGIPAYIVKKGETYDQITKKFNLWRFQIRKYNNLPKSTALQEGTVIYLKPKKRKGDEEYHTVQAGESMYYISQATGVKLKRLYKLNRLEEGQEPAAGELIYLRKKRELLPQLDELNNHVALQGVIIKKPDAQAPKGNKPMNTAQVNNKPSDLDKSFHSVAAGETLFSISKTYQVGIADLLDWNNIPDSTVRVGQLLRIKAPATTQADTATKLTKPDGSLSSEPAADGQTLYAPVKDTNKEKLPSNTQSTPVAKSNNDEFFSKTYIVQPGETLYAISRKTGTTVEDLKKLNNLSDNSVKVGQTLVVKPVNSQLKKPDSKTYIVQTGDTMYSVSKKFGLTVEQLKKLNNMENNNLSIGQQLTVSQ